MEVIYPTTYYRIIMKTYDGKKLYLKDGVGKSCEWTFNKQEALWFETNKEAEDFAKQYFKNFSNYEIEDFIEYM